MSANFTWPSPADGITAFTGITTGTNLPGIGTAGIIIVIYVLVLVIFRSNMKLSSAAMGAPIAFLWGMWDFGGNSVVPVVLLVLYLVHVLYAVFAEEAS